MEAEIIMIGGESDSKNVDELLLKEK